ncbi:MAG: hypothetical protein ABH950_01170 [Candidatus Altiarchaeota archaeon]
MNQRELLEELNRLLLSISDDEVDFELGSDELEDLREGLATLILRLNKEGID